MEVREVDITLYENVGYSIINPEYPVKSFDFKKLEDDGDTHKFIRVYVHGLESPSDILYHKLSEELRIKYTPDQLNMIVVNINETNLINKIF